MTTSPKTPKIRAGNKARPKPPRLIELIKYYEDRAARAGDKSSTRHFLELITRIRCALDLQYEEENGDPAIMSQLDLRMGKAHLELANTHMNQDKNEGADNDEGRLYLDMDSPVLNPEKRTTLLQNARRAFHEAAVKDPPNPDPLIGISLSSARMARLIEKPHQKAYLLLESIAAGARAEASLSGTPECGARISSVFSENIRIGLKKHLAGTVLRYGKFLSYRADKDLYHLQDRLQNNEGWDFIHPAHLKFLYDPKRYTVSEKADLLYRTFLLSREKFKEADAKASDAGMNCLECKIRMLDCGIQLGRLSHELDKPLEARDKLEDTVKQLLKLRKIKSRKNPPHEESIACLLGDAYIQLSQLKKDNPEASAKDIIRSLEHLQTAKEMYHDNTSLTDERDPGIALTRQLDFQAKAYQLLGESLTKIEIIGIDLRKKLRRLFNQDKINRPAGSTDNLSPQGERQNIQYAKEAFCASIEATRIAHDRHGDGHRSIYHLGLTHLWLAKANYLEFLTRKHSLESRMMGALFAGSPPSRLRAISVMDLQAIEDNLNPSEKDKSLDTMISEAITEIALSNTFSPKSIARDITYLIVEAQHFNKNMKPEKSAVEKLGHELYSYASSIREEIERKSANAIMNLSPDPRWTYIIALIKETFNIRGGRAAGRTAETLINIALDPKGATPSEAYWRIRKVIDKEIPTNIHRSLQQDLIADIEMAIIYLDRSLESDHSYLRPAYEKLMLNSHFDLDEIDFPIIDGEWPESKLTLKNREKLRPEELIAEFKSRRKKSGEEPVFYHLGKGKGGWVKSKYGFLPLFEKEMTPIEAKLVAKLYPNIMIDYEPYENLPGLGLALLHDGGKDMQRQICTLIGEIKTLNKFLRDGVGDPTAIRRELIKKTGRRISMYLSSAKEIPKTSRAILSVIDTGGADERGFKANCNTATYVREALRNTRPPDRTDKDGKTRQYRVKYQDLTKRPERPIFTLDGELLHVRPFQTPDDYVRRIHDSLMKYARIEFPKHPQTGLLRFLIHYTKHIAIPLAKRQRSIYFDAKAPNKLAYGFCDLNSLKWTHLEENWASYLCTEGAELPGLKIRPNFQPHEMKRLLTALHRATCREFPEYTAPLEDVLASWHAIEAGKALTLLGHEYKQQVEEINEKLKPEQKAYWMRRSDRAAKYYKNLVVHTLEQSTRNELIEEKNRKGLSRFLNFVKGMVIEPGYQNKTKSATIDYDEGELKKAA